MQRILISDPDLQKEGWVLLQGYPLMTDDQIRELPRTSQSTGDSVEGEIVPRLSVKAREAPPCTLSVADPRCAEPHTEVDLQYFRC